jgi:SAM-dependent methyltransferase
LIATTTCWICGGPSSTFQARDTNRAVSELAFIYHTCDRCHGVWIDKPPTDLGRYYLSGYHFLPGSIDELHKYAVNERFKLDILTRLTPRGRVLEVGPSFGAFAHLALTAGYDVAGIEMDPDCCRLLRDLLRMRVVESDDPAAALGEFHEIDVIAMWQVLEHLANMEGVLAATSRSLRQGGRLIVATPNPRSVQARFWGKRWTHLDAPRHLCLLPLPALVDLASRAGFELEFATFTDEGSLGWNTFGWATSMANLARNGVAKRVLAVSGRVLSVALRPIERLGDNGASYTAVFRKAS